MRHPFIIKIETNDKQRGFNETVINTSLSGQLTCSLQHLSFSVRRLRLACASSWHMCSQWHIVSSKTLHISQRTQFLCANSTRRHQIRPARIKKSNFIRQDWVNDLAGTCWMNLPIIRHPSAFLKPRGRLLISKCGYRSTKILSWVLIQVSWELSVEKDLILLRERSIGALFNWLLFCFRLVKKGFESQNSLYLVIWVFRRNKTNEHKLASMKCSIIDSSSWDVVKYSTLVSLWFIEL